MKKLFIFFLFFIITISLKATTYYISTTGNNGNNGSSGSPWRNLYYACAHTANGDIIHINAGSYTETNQCVLAPGVSIEGVDTTTSIIQCRYTGGSQLILNNGSLTTGNQHIYNVKFDGNYPTTSNVSSAILVTYRTSVEIANCSIINFLHSGIEFIAQNGCDYSYPTVFATGNSVHHTAFRNCAEYYWQSSDHSSRDYGDGIGALRMDTQDGMLVYNNTINIVQRTSEYTGYAIKGICGYNKNCKIYNNTIRRTPCDGHTYDFAIEQWNGRGGNEIYNNDIRGGAIDLSGGGGNIKGSANYSWWIYDNSIGNIVLGTVGAAGIIYETNFEYLLIERNYIYNVISAIYSPQYADWGFGANCTLSNNTIRYNILENIGTYGIAVWFGTDANTTLTNYSVYNNVLIGTNSTGMSQYGIGTSNNPISESTNTLYIKNNIVTGFSSGAIIFSKTVSSGAVQNNICYGNGNNTPSISGTATINGNLTTQPPFVLTSDFHLTAARTGINISTGSFLSTNIKDYDLNNLSSTPTIGAYEFNTGNVAPTVYTTSLSEIHGTIVTTGGNISSDGGSTITAKGVCYDIVTNPTVGSSKTSDGSGNGSYTSSITGLTSSTRYYFRAYATNSAGTGYGSTISGKTHSTFVMHNGKHKRHNGKYIKR